MRFSFCFRFFVYQVSRPQNNYLRATVSEVVMRNKTAKIMQKPPKTPDSNLTK